MTDRTPRHLGEKGPSPENRGSAEEGVPDRASGVEADGGLSDGDPRPAWTRRAVAGGLVAAVAGALFGITQWPRPKPRDGGVVPLAPPQPVPAQVPEAPADLLPQEMASAAPETSAANEPEPDQPATAQRPAGRPQIAIVIDDLGLRQSETRRAVDLPGPLTLAFLPYGQALAGHADRARAKGHEVIVHLPMDPGGRANPGPEALRLGQSAAELDRRLTWNLGQVPGHAGANNHMGSALTENPAAMALVLERLKRNGGYFLDSRTTAKSAARSVAARIGLPYAERDVFLDNDTTPAAIQKQLAETEALARRYGTAIAIGHPHTQTLTVLDTWLKQADARGFDVVPVSAIIATRGSALWRVARDRKGSARS